MNNRISVIIPIYNAEKYLNKCLDSLINQTYKNLEIVLINDGSKDKSLEIMKEYKKKDKRIIIIDKKNTGVSDTRNIGINKSTGKYIMFIDADDYIESDYVELMYNELKNKKYDLVISGNKVVDNNYKVINNMLYTNKNTKLTWKKIEKDFINTLYFSQIWKILIDRDIIITNNIKFDKNLSYGEDMLFIYNLLHKSNNFGYLAYCGYNYYQSNDSVTHKQDISKVDKYIKDNLYIFNYFRKEMKDDKLIYNRLYSKYNISMLKLVDYKYKDFKKYCKYYKEVLELNRINIKEIDYENKKNRLLIYLLSKKLYLIYYLIIKMYKRIKRK